MWCYLQDSPHFVTNPWLPQLQRWIPYASVVLLIPFAEAKVWAAAIVKTIFWITL